MTAPASFRVNEKYKCSAHCVVLKISICIPLSNLEMTGFGGLFEYVCALSQNRSSKIHLLRILKIAAKPSNPVI